MREVKRNGQDEIHYSHGAVRAGRVQFGVDVDVDMEKTRVTHIIYHTGIAGRPTAAGRPTGRFAERKEDYETG